MKKLRFILLEDSPSDVELIFRELRRSGMQFECQQTCERDAFEQTLGMGPWDLIISDFNMPSFTAFDALNILKSRSLQIPLVVVSGVVGDETAAGLMKSGAVGFVAKDNLGGLPTLISCEISRKQAEDALRQKDMELKEAQKIAHVGSWFWDMSADTTIASEELLSMFGQPCRPFQELNGTMFPAESWDELNCAVQRAVQTGVGYEIDLEALRGDGTKFWITSRGEIVRDSQGVIIGLRGTVQDITARKECEQALHNANCMKDLFLATVSHDLKNPLSAIQLCSSLAIRAYKRGGLAPELSVANFERILRTSQQMKQIIGDLLDLSRIEAGKFMIERGPCSVAEIVCCVFDLLGPLADGKSMILSHSLEPIVEVQGFWDKNRLVQVFSNILGNAIKFAPEGGKVLVNGLVQNNSVFVSVQDNGSGISSEDLPHVFDRYWQAKKTERQGTGLGLSIAQGIIHAHEGKIWVESEVGQGTIVHVALPINSGT
ncbi:MAG: hypothetical protein A2X86_07060 [Bdellovibrionales bacterium GWA2_49_15]|nr:MAG: hypothetical protein A2X86_07060 [Bdellovibrionales bacterium GWA2_49_15]HAZ11965.1 hypothetical protein [Bdellovibrionales bacterium]